MALVAILAGCSTGAATFDFGGPRPLVHLNGDPVETALAIAAPGETVETVRSITAAGLGEELAEVVTDQRAFYIRPSGEIVASDLLPALEREAYESRFGRLSAELFERVDSAADCDSLHVYVMVAGDYLLPELGEPQPDVAISTDQFQAWVDQQRAMQLERMVNAKEPVLALLGDDTPPGEGLDYLPFIEAYVSVATLRSVALNTSDHVISVMSVDDDEPAMLLGYAGQSSMKVPSLVGGTCGPAPQGPPASSCGGAGLPVGIWERDETNGVFYSAIATANSRLDHGALGETYLNTPASCNSDSNCPDSLDQSGLIANKRKCINGRCVEEHMTYVAGSLGMVGTFTYTGDCAPNTTDSFGNAGLWDVKYRVGNDNNPNGLNYILGQSAVYANKSATFNQASRKAADFSGQYYGLFLTAAGGNTGTGITVQCGELRNGLCVGGYDYNTYSDTTSHRWWSNSNDANVPNYPERPHLLGPATFQNLGNGLALPEIAAIGSTPPTMRYGDYNTLGTCGGQGQAIFGTSFASPAVLAAAVLSHQYEGLFSLLAWPQVTKAVVMAGSIDSNVDGAIGLSNVSWSANVETPTVRVRDGAGHPDLSIIKAMLDANQYFGRDMANTDFVSCGAGCREYVVANNLSIPVNKSAKVALTWSACSTSAGNDAFLANDLDLVGTRVCNGTTTTLTSNTVSSETEMVFGGCGAQTGTITLRIRIKNGATIASCGTRTTERVGVAWSFQ